MPELVVPEVIESPPAVAEVPESGEDLLAVALSDLTPTTRTLYRKDFERFATWVGIEDLGTFAAHFLRLPKSQAAKIVRNYREHMESKGYEPATIARALQAIVGLVERWYVASEPERGVIYAPWSLKGLVRRPKPPKYTDVEGIPHDDWKQLLSTVQDIRTANARRDTAILLLLHDAMLRAREVSTLSLEHYDTRRREVRVWRKRASKGTRTPQPLTSRAVDALERWLDVRELDPGPLFVRLPLEKHGLSAMDTNGIAYVTRKWAKIAGIPGPVSPHRFRHAGITRLAELGTSPDVLSQVAGHASFDTTMIYIRRASTELRDAVSQLEED
jgi:integrase